MKGFWDWWQHLPQNISPDIFQIGPFKLRYYGLMYIVAFAITYVIVLYRIRHEARFAITRKQVSDFLTYAILGLTLGARLGYVIFYNLSYYVRNPLEILLPFKFSNGVTVSGFSGLSYHGGLIGIILAAWFYVRKSGLSFPDMLDLFVPCAPLGYTFGRLGNFANGELYGRITTAPIGMLFPLAPERALRHPSQLYEAFFEGIFLFAVMWRLRKVKAPRGSMLAFYLIGYGMARFLVEYFRDPDENLGFVFLSFSMGQMLCLGMILSGIILFFCLKRIAKQGSISKTV